MTLQVIPEDLPGIGALLSTIETGLASALSSAAATAHPAPAAVDPVSQAAALCFTAYTESLTACSARGVGYLRDGSSALHPVSIDYSVRDISSGSDVAARGIFTP